jgi:hypothetical protein
LKITGLIQHGVISFSNAYYKHTYQYKNFAHDKHSYCIFGGYNSSQIVGGEQGLADVKMASDKLNPSNFWGVTTRGFAFGNTTLLDPEED